ncbi:MAG: class I SAM-dependent methyltransferase [Eubacteriales bacterium]|nr:class I SAM-dependent methyltransferase [Eubacteriales bacterium]
MFITKKWQDYEIIDAGNGNKLERWKTYVLKRPDPQTIWNVANEELWQNCHAVYDRSQSGGGAWNFIKKLPERWQVTYGDWQFYVRPTGFKHTGLFPEQAANWDFMVEQIQKCPKGRQAKVLNLFGYTGGASVALAKSGAHVTHVDAAKGMVQWAKENMQLNKVDEQNVRYIVEDAKRFVQREIRRGNHYDGIVMDPPSYGRGPGGELWKLEDELQELVALCAQLLSDDACFFVLNGYTTGFSQSVLYNIVDRELVTKHGGTVDADELCLPITAGGFLPCGTSARWTK